MDEVHLAASKVKPHPATPTITVIANAPNPAGQAILNKHFEDGIAPGGLLKAALIPTVIMFLAYSLFA